ncbi:hypothetical protein BJ973_003408 [Actinoplanes tereljensis]|uniref:Uncharacterized protein n=1 Tax=Paractinoplanes tereljensis TaxID=571912 RepID=A0A919NWR1_9ACTN|nr:hypothetical protein [Actinoplanes tereljensis]GIF26138.1 hypothetical protein Ate02nite_88680 [Actinoplanes tereljensis]
MTRLRFVVVVLAFLALLAGLATPAAAAGIPDIEVEAPQLVTVVDGRTTTVTVTVVNHSRTEVTGLVLHFGESTTSQVGGLAAGRSRTFRFPLSPTAALVATFEVAVTGAASDSTPVTVVRAAAGTDLAIAGIDDVTVDHGNYANVPITIRNNGTSTISNLAVVLVAEQGLQPMAGYTNCEFDRTDDFSYTAVTCRIDQAIAPGETLALPATTNPLLVKVAQDAAGPYEYAVSAAVVGVGDAAAAAESGPRLTLQPAKTPADRGGSVASFGITVSTAPAEVTVDDDTTTTGSSSTHLGSTGWFALFLSGALVFLIARRRRLA